MRRARYIAAFVVAITASGTAALWAVRHRADHVEGSRNDAGVEGTMERDDGKAVVAATLDLLRSAQNEPYVRLNAFEDLPDGARVQLESETWAQRFFTADATPYRRFTRIDREVHHATEAAPVDLIRYGYRAQGFDLVVREAVSFEHVEIRGGADDLLTLPVEARGRRIHEIARALFKVEGTYDFNGTPRPYAWAFAFPDELGEGAQFRTSNKDPMWMWSWADRVDGGIKAGHLWLLLHKRRESTSGRNVWLNDREWFSGHCWDAYR
jgi:hypothetical protein